MSVNDELETASEPAALSPSERFRAQVVSGSGRIGVACAISTNWLMDTLLARYLVGSGVVTVNRELVNDLEWASTCVFVVSSCLLLLAMTRRYFTLLIPVATVYLGMAVAQVVVNVIGMLSTASSHHGGGLGTLWDVGLLYGMSVVVFMFVYAFLDVTTPGGAFVWPARDGQEPPTPHLLDYLFISLNVNSTYGPTSEAIMSRPGKLLMALQVLLAVMMLTVLISRAVASTS